MALRGVKSAVKNAEIAKRPDKLAEEDIIKVLRSEIKKRQDAIFDFKKGNRQDLVDKESREIEIIKRYLPPELTEEKLREMVEKAIKDTGATSPKDFGKVMGAVMKEVKGQVDGGRVKEIVGNMLGSPAK